MGNGYRTIGHGFVQLWKLALPTKLGSKCYQAEPTHPGVGPWETDTVGLSLLHLSQDFTGTPV